MRNRFILISTILLSIFALLWNGFIHLFILKVANDNIKFIHRSDMAKKMWISILITITIVFLYTISYLKWRKKGTVYEAIQHGLFFAVLMIVVVDLNQYVQYEIPFSLILKWSLFGVIEFVIYGIILNKLYKKMIPT